MKLYFGIVWGLSAAAAASPMQSKPNRNNPGSTCKSWRGKIFVAMYRTTLSVLTWLHADGNLKTSRQAIWLNKVLRALIWSFAYFGCIGEAAAAADNPDKKMITELFIHLLIMCCIMYTKGDLTKCCTLWLGKAAAAADNRDNKLKCSCSYICWLCVVECTQKGDWIKCCVLWLGKAAAAADTPDNNKTIKLFIHLVTGNLLLLTPSWPRGNWSCHALYCDANRKTRGLSSQ